MGSQFVDLNADGHTDYLTATFDGSPHVAYGGAEGFGEPERLLDAQGERLILSHYWNYESESHEVTDRAMGTDEPRKERCISALAYDWDADGDYDLLLGSYENGRLYRQMNEGSNAEPRYTGENLPVLAGDEPFALEAKMTAPRLVDWDGDGDLDLLAGSFGDCYGEDVGGGVYLSLDQGEKGAPAFGPLLTLIEPSTKGMRKPSRPDAGLYPEAADLDGDGDLDLVVGAYSMWIPPGRELSAEEQVTVTELRAELAAAQARYDEFNRRFVQQVEDATADLEEGSDEWDEVYEDLWTSATEDRQVLLEAVGGVRERLDALVPRAKREPYVWFYERL